MSPPQHFMTGINSGDPLQFAIGNLALELADPETLCLEHRDLVLQLDERQSRPSACTQLTHDPRQLFGGCAQRDDPFAQELRGLLGLEMMNEHEAGGETRVLPSWPRHDLP